MNKLTVQWLAVAMAILIGGNAHAGWWAGFRLNGRAYVGRISRDVDPKQGRVHG